MAKYDTLDEYMASITKPENAQQLSSTLDWISTQYPQLELRLAWNQPMFTDHDTFIIGFSAATKDFAVAVEAPVFEKHLPQITALGYRATKRQFHVAWGTEIDESLLHHLIDDAIALKKNVTTFWLPKDK
ncbi:DUF1801 domain-containing protein [Lactobacillus sp. LC28-10]|uniref:DUF1801 domain-containing protein n=1 Tax=Secundilactobacillus angelensis TaxID=2722706 RepID=A0ABX1KY33_9LACO|nr:DUF1801 domain-containing protein [Secundilactobacillus angelensis]MCH5461603.1 DUF1801 domain-containing protein [Secundilactobacillus angelensis]NLR17898.1 DUF1801 domain-containing protein [Secundilactobacillus angelensis]